MEVKQKTYLQVLQDTMQPMKDMLSYYEKRLKYIDEEFDSKSIR